MASVSSQDIAKLREHTGVGVMAAKQALVKSKGDFEKAVVALRMSGERIAASKVKRSTGEGLIGHYVHSNGKIASFVVVTCETDFVARSQPFRELAHDLALHIAAANPEYMKPEDIPPDVIEREREIFRSQLKRRNKPERVKDQIVNGRLEKFFNEQCLLRQSFVKDETRTISDLVTAAIHKLGENITIREFIRLSL